MVVYVAAVLPQMQRDSVRTGPQRGLRGVERIGEAAAAGVAQGGYVVDVYA